MPSENNVMYRKIVISFLFSAVVLFVSCTERSRNAEQTEMRIVSLAPSLTKNLYFLDAQDKIVGVTNFCVAIENASIVASVVTPNIERIVALRPSMVLVAGTLISPDVIATLRRFRIQVEMFDTPQSFDEICEQFLRLGELIGKPEKAERIVNESRERVEIVSERAQALWTQPCTGITHSERTLALWKTTPSVFFQIGANPLFTVLPNTFMDDYITFLGGRNIAENLRTGIIGREFVIAQNPDFIFIAIMGGVSEEEKNVWNRHSQMNAVRNGQIFTIDPDMACLPTPVTFAETMETLYELIVEQVFSRNHIVNERNVVLTDRPLRLDIPFFLEFGQRAVFGDFIVFLESWEKWGTMAFTPDCPPPGTYSSTNFVLSNNSEAFANYLRLNDSARQTRRRNSVNLKEFRIFSDNPVYYMEWSGYRVEMLGGGSLVFATIVVSRI